MASLGGSTYVVATVTLKFPSGDVVVSEGLARNVSENPDFTLDVDLSGIDVKSLNGQEIPVGKWFNWDALFGTREESFAG